MNDAALDHDILEDGFGALFQAGYAVHADKKDILYTTALDLVKYLHPVVFSLRIPDPDTQHVLDSIYIIAQDNVDRTALCLQVLADIDIKAVYEEEGIEFLQRTILPFSGRLYHTVCDCGDRFVRYLKSIYLLNGTGNIPLAHSFGVHAQNLILDPTDILGTFGD